MIKYLVNTLSDRLTIRPYQPSDRSGVRAIFGDDEFACPTLSQRYPRFADYLADSMSHYFDYELESTFVALVDKKVVGALLGALDTKCVNEIYAPRIRKLLRHRILIGKYGWPDWLWSYFLTERVGRSTIYPEVDLTQYSAHLHIGLSPDWRRQGIGTALMQAYEGHLKQHNIPGYHLYVSSYNAMGLAF